MNISPKSFYRRLCRPTIDLLSDEKATTESLAREQPKYFSRDLIDVKCSDGLTPNDFLETSSEGGRLPLDKRKVILSKLNERIDFNPVQNDKLDRLIRENNVEFNANGIDPIEKNSLRRNKFSSAISKYITASSTTKGGRGRKTHRRGSRSGRKTHRSGRKTHRRGRKTHRR
jgi:hypothetical protein